MRALHLYSGNLYGGIETLLVSLARHRTPEMDAGFGLCFEGRLAAELRAAGAAVHPLGEVRLSRPTTVWRARRRLRRLLARERYDAVVCHSSWPTAVFGPAIRASGAPLVLWLHDRVDPSHWLQRLAARSRPALAVCNSRYTAETLGRLYPGVPGPVVYPPVERAPARADRVAVRTELGTPAGDVVVAQVSRMEGWKGHEPHLRALAPLREVPGWTCWIVGGAQRPEEAAYEARLRDLSASLGLEGRVRFLGQRRDVPRLLDAADLFCQPNTGPEPFGIVFVEALLAGLPVVGTAIGGALEIVSPECGVLVPPADPRALTEALGGLIRDAPRRAALSAAGPARAFSLCDPARQVARLREVLAEAPGLRPGEHPPTQVVPSEPSR